MHAGFGSILAAAIISGLNGKAGMAGWRWLCSSLHFLTKYSLFSDLSP
jgi:hypothetical protein